MGSTVLLAACSRHEQGDQVVTLYTSADAFLAQPVVQAAEQATGLSVRLVTDSEATKTMGLVQRLVGERSRPVADVWWSSEALGTIGLSRQGLLKPWSPASLATEFGGVWPGGLSDSGNNQAATWYGVAQRARVIAYSTRRIVKVSDAPSSLEGLCNVSLRGRVGLARPQFGTTRSHIAAHVVQSGELAVRGWLERFRVNQPRVYEGNSAVVHALGVGEIDVGLTDTDDVWAGQGQGWPVAAVFEQDDGSASGDHALALPSRGAIVIPNTVAIISNCPNPQRAQRLAEFLVSEEAERLMASSESRNAPVRQALAQRLARSDKRLHFPLPANVAWHEVGNVLDATDRLINEFFPV